MTKPKIARHLSLFGEEIALTETLTWLKELKHKKLEKHKEGKLLDLVVQFINQKDFLPHAARLEDINSDAVLFLDGNGCRIPVGELSDGYRSILSMTFELIRQLAITYGYDKIFSEDASKIVAPGVVLIDEVDAHLHPTWQRRIGQWFRAHFPKIQFLVTSHSPLVCQAADVGTVWRLPKPGDDEPGGMVTGVDLDRLVHGNVLDAYSTGIFGPGITRSEDSAKHLARLAELNQQFLKGKLSAAEIKERDRLQSMLPTAAHTLTTAEATEDPS